MCKFSTCVPIVGLVSLSQAQECWNRVPIDTTALVDPNLLLDYSTTWCPNNVNTTKTSWTKIALGSNSFYVGKIGTFGNEHQCEVAWNKTVTGCHDGKRGGGGYTDSYYTTGGATDGYSLELIFGAWPTPVSAATSTSTPTPTPSPTPGWKTF
jgi:hypothetical protein